MGRSCMHLAAMYNLHEVVAPLATKGIKLDIEDRYGLKAVHIAIECKHSEFLSALFDEYASELIPVLTANKENLVIWALKTFSWKCLQVILQNGLPEILSLASPNGEFPYKVAE